MMMIKAQVIPSGRKKTTGKHEPYSDPELLALKKQFREKKSLRQIIDAVNIVSKVTRSFDSVRTKLHKMNLHFRDREI